MALCHSCRLLGVFRKQYPYPDRSIKLFLQTKEHNPCKQVFNENTSEIEKISPLKKGVWGKLALTVVGQSKQQTS